MDIEANTYSEIYDVLRFMDKTAITKIPIDILNAIKEKRNVSYISNIDPENVFDRKNMSEQAFKILMWININYWMSEEEKEKINNLAKQKIQKEEITKSIKYQEKYGDIEESLFKKRKKNIEQEKEVALIDVKRGIFGKILDKIKALFKR